MKLVLALTGASGIVYGTRLAEELKKKCELSIIVSNAARKVAEYENIDLGVLGDTLKEEELDAAPASGSALYDAMVVCPCSMKTLAAIANGHSYNLISRAADVMLKEGRKLVLVFRETPVSAVQLENMLKLARLGVIIMPASPGFYNKPKEIKDLVDHVVGKAMDALRVEHDLFKRWKS